MQPMRQFSYQKQVRPSSRFTNRSIDKSVVSAAQHAPQVDLEVNPLDIEEDNDAANNEESHRALDAQDCFAESYNSVWD